ncbi:Rrf2 family transcriptional regulator, partial [Candidatus Aerophobetes bacterium]|nr:Rrf2 family transcriptional regulator [Candidatus Aerophobetes bacterium]
DYALAAVIYLAQENKKKRYSLKELSNSTGIPEEFLRKIFQILAKEKVISSFKGKGGGISLARLPEKITLYEIVAPFENEGLVRCLRGELCPRKETCTASLFWKEMTQRFLKVLKKTTLKDVIEYKNKKR